MAINEETLGVPVIAIGVPTVIDAATIVSDTMDLIVADLKQNAKENEALFKMLSVIAEEDKYSMIRQVLTPNHESFVVTPKEVDSLVENVSDIIANGINIALHEGITLADIDRYK
jgi:spore protease